VRFPGIAIVSGNPVAVCRIRLNGLKIRADDVIDKASFI
jgi:hypothetical protein